MPELDVFHIEKGEVSQEMQEHIEIVKNLAGQLHDAITNATNAKLGIGVHSHPEQVRRCEAIGKTNLEAAVMWAIKGLTKPSEPTPEQQNELQHQADVEQELEIEAETEKMHEESK